MGPSLASAGIPDAIVLHNPIIDLRGADGALIMSNDDWVTSPQRSQIEGTVFQPPDDRESVILATLTPGNYTAILAGAGQTTGVGIVEIYDNDASADSDLANVSTRGFVRAGDEVMIAGFILGQTNGPTQVALRALGPSLTSSGLNNVLEDPVLELHDVNGVIIASNDNWNDNPVSAAELSARGLALPHPNESGIFSSLPAGQFTVILAGKNGGIGLGLIEVYNLK
jgi:hypothetical protein